MDMGEFRREELQTPVYQTVVQNFTEDTFTYWSHICITRAPHKSGTSKATDIYPTHLHVISLQTLVGRRTTLGNVTILDSFLLSQVHRGLSIEMGWIIAQIARNFATNPRKQSLGLGPFITWIIYHLELDIARSDLMEVSSSNIPTDLTVLQNMGVVDRDEELCYNLRLEQSQQEQPLIGKSSKTPLPTQPSLPPFVPCTAFKRYMVQQMLSRQDAGEVTMRHMLMLSRQDAGEVVFEDIRRLLYELHQRDHPASLWSMEAIDEWFHDKTQGSQFFLFFSFLAILVYCTKI